MNDESENPESKKYYEHFHFEIDKGQGPVRIDKFLTSRIQYSSRNKIQNAARENRILVNNIAVKPHYKIKPDDIISILFDKPPREKGILAEEILLEIIYEDDYLMIVNKPAGMVVHPAFNNFTGTLVNALTDYFNKLTTQTPGRLLRPGLVHRIDKGTSGLMVIAKEKNTLQSLYQQFFDHSIRRTYRALVWGSFETNSGTIRGKLVKDLNSQSYINYPQHKEGKEAITHYTVLENFKGLTLVECKLETGRTHQIRAQMKYAGHPLFSDAVYGGNKILADFQDKAFQDLIESCFKILPGQALHARSLGFIHPKFNQDIYFELEMPEAMLQVLKILREYPGF